MKGGSEEYLGSAAAAAFSHHCITSDRRRLHAYQMATLSISFSRTINAAANRQSHDGGVPLRPIHQMNHVFCCNICISNTASSIISKPSRRNSYLWKPLQHTLLFWPYRHSTVYSNLPFNLIVFPPQLKLTFIYGSLEPVALCIAAPVVRPWEQRNDHFRYIIIEWMGGLIDSLKLLETNCLRGGLSDVSCRTTLHKVVDGMRNTVNPTIPTVSLKMSHFIASPHCRKPNCCTNISTACDWFPC